MTQSIDTICVQGGYQPEDGGPRQLPIYQSTTWKYDTSEHMGRLFDLEEEGYFYTRLQNPTNDAVAANAGGAGGERAKNGRRCARWRFGALLRRKIWGARALLAGRHGAAAYNGTVASRGSAPLMRGRLPRSD